MIKCEIDFEFPDLASILEKNIDQLQLFIAGQLQYNRAMLFDSEGSYNGHQKWKGLAFRKGMILSNRGTLRKSIAPISGEGQSAQKGPSGILEVDRVSVIIGTQLAYARMMNDGTTKMPDGVLRPVKAKALKIPIPSGMNATEGAKSMKTHKEGKQKFIFRKSVRIPARDFETLNNRDEKEISDALGRKITQMLGKP